MYRQISLLSILLISVFTCLDRDPNYTIDEELSDPGSIISEGCGGFQYPDWKNSPYVLPYPVGESYLIDLSHCTNSYHAEGQPDQFAIDFNMPRGTLITAVSSGTVVHVEESGIDGQHPNNLVVVEQAGDTFAQYMHLTRDGALVEVGEAVVPGQPIGYSGFTGLAGYPHLHFIITKGGWQYPYDGIPYNFRNTRANPNSLISNESYEALPY